MSTEDQLSEAARVLALFINDHEKALGRKGFCIEEVVALDLNKGSIVFYMTSGDVVRVKGDTACFEGFQEEDLN